MNSTRDQKSIIKNFFAMFILQIGNFLVPIVTLPYLSRTLKIESFGVYSFSLAVVMAAGVFVEWGFPLCATGDVASNRNDFNKLANIISSTILAKLLLALFALIVIMIFCELYSPFQKSQSVLIFAFGIVVAYVFNLGWYLQGMESMSLFAITSLFARMLTIPAVLIMVHGKDQAWLAVAIQSFAAILGSIFSIFLVVRRSEFHWQWPSLNDILARINESKHFFLAAAAINLYTASTVIVMGMVSNPSSVAIYAGADRIKSASQNVIAPLSQVFYPRVVKLFKEDFSKGEILVQAILIIFGLIGFFVSLSIFLFADLIVKILLGEAFKDSANVLRIMAFIPFFSAISNVISVQAMIPLGMSSKRSMVLIFVTLLSIPSTFFAAKYFGSYGVASVVLFSELFGLLMFCYLIRKDLIIIRPSSIFKIRNFLSS